MTQRTITGGFAYNYTYSGDGELLKRTNTSGNTWVRYVGGIYEITNAGSITKYYSLGGKTIAERRSGTLTYIHGDHLGSASVMTDSAGAYRGRVKYWPFGVTRLQQGVVTTDKKYTGQQQESGDALMLYHYGARVYSTMLGRFLSVDPIGSNATDSQSWNPYSYVRNNPLRYTDPSGMCVPGVNCPGDKEENAAASNAAAEAWQNSRTIEIERSGCDASCQGALAAQSFAAAAHEEMVAALQYLAWADSNSIEQVRDAQPVVNERTVSSDSNDSGGGCGRLSFVCDVGASLSSVASQAVDGLQKCADSSTCTTLVGGTIVIASPLCLGAAAFCALGGGVIMAYGDTKACIGGNKVSCGLAVADVATIGGGALAIKAGTKGTIQVARPSNVQWVDRMIRNEDVGRAMYAEVGTAALRAANGAFQVSADYRTGVALAYVSKAIELRD